VQTIVDSEAWIRRFHPVPEAGLRLVCFPHAGGACTFYFPMSAALAPDVEVLAVQYPGRQERRSEEPLRDLHVLADRVTEALAPWTTTPLALFGHSMGALLAYEVGLRLRERHGVSPRVLFASGRRAPSTHRDENVHRRDDDGLVRELKRLAGTESAVLADEEVLRMVLPAIRGDYEAAETYTPREGSRLACPVSVLVGDSDPRVTRAEADAWARHTSGGFDLREFTGGHFYLSAHQDEVTALVRDRLAREADAPTAE